MPYMFHALEMKVTVTLMLSMLSHNDNDIIRKMIYMSRMKKVKTKIKMILKWFQ